jgi:preprotein translocase subunit SecA
MEQGREYRIDWKARAVRLLPAADPLIDGLRPPTPALVPRAARREGLSQALAALHLYNRNEHYVLSDEEEVVIVDEFTGRVMPDRQWQKGLHQMIEAKEAVEASADRVTLAQITYQTFFSRYLWFSGMTGTAVEVAREMTLTHDRPVMRVPTHRRIRRRLLPTRAYGSSNARWAAVVKEAVRMQAKGRPVLVGTRSVAASEEIAKALRAAGLDPVVLNAHHSADEAQIVAGAGQAGALTVATNMAGRGTDIPVPDAVARQGGLHVIITEFHGSARIDRQLIGRSGRQGQPGSARAIVSLEDALFTEFVPGRLRVLHRLIGARRGRVPGGLAERLRRAAQAISERRGRARRSQTVRRAERLEKALGFQPDDI